MTARRTLFLICALAVLVPGAARSADDPYEVGSESVPFMQPMNGEVEFYRRQIAGMDFTTFMFSPALAGTSRVSEDPFWTRTDAQTPSLAFIGESLLAVPVHILWDTPVNMGRTLKSNFIDTWSTSENGIHIAQDLVFGIPNTMMVMLNGMIDSVEQLQADVIMPVAGGILLWPPRWFAGLFEGTAVHGVIDLIPKSMWTIGLPTRKATIIVGDQTQKGINLVYKVIHDPDEISDHFNMYWGSGKSSTHPAPGEVQD